MAVDTIYRGVAPSGGDPSYYDVASARAKLAGEPESGHAQAHLAECLCRAGLRDEAWENAVQAVRLGLGAYTAFWLRRLSRLAMERMRVDLAVEWLERSLSIEPNSWETRALLGWLMSEPGLSEAARPNPDGSMPAEPSDAASWRARGCRHYALHQLADARSDFQRCAELEPDYPQVGEWLIASWLSDHEAHEDLGVIASIPGEAYAAVPYASLVAGRALARDERFDDAIAHLRRFVKAHPGSARPSYELARLCWIRGWQRLSLPLLGEAYLRARRFW